MKTKILTLFFLLVMMDYTAYGQGSLNDRWTQLITGSGSMMFHRDETRHDKYYYASLGYDVVITHGFFLGGLIDYTGNYWNEEYVPEPVLLPGIYLRLNTSDKMLMAGPRVGYIYGNENSRILPHISVAWLWGKARSEYVIEYIFRSEGTYNQNLSGYSVGGGILVPVNTGIAFRLGINYGNYQYTLRYNSTEQIGEVTEKGSVSMIQYGIGMTASIRSTKKSNNHE